MTPLMIAGFTIGLLLGPFLVVGLALWLDNLFQAFLDAIDEGMS